MNMNEMEARIIKLETTLAQLLKKPENADIDTRPWWEQIMGKYADDADYDEAMRLGREYRESLRPKDDEFELSEDKAK